MQQPRDIVEATIAAVLAYQEKAKEPHTTIPACRVAAYYAALNAPFIEDWFAMKIAEQIELVYFCEIPV